MYKTVKCITIFFSIVFFASTIQAEQTVIFAVGEWSPFVSETMNNYGPTAEIVSMACKEAGLKPKFEFSPWSRSYYKVKTGSAVATFPWKKTAERAVEVLFPETPIMVSKEYVYYLPEKFPNGILAAKLEDLKPYKLVGVRSYWYEKASEKLGLDMHIVSKAESAWRMVNAQRKDAYIENELVAKNDLKTIFPNDHGKFSHAPDPLSASDMYILFSRVHPDATAIMGKIEEAIKKLKKQGIIDKILNK